MTMQDTANAKYQRVAAVADSIGADFMAVERYAGDTREVQIAQLLRPPAALPGEWQYVVSALYHALNSPEGAAVRAMAEADAEAFAQ